MVSRLIHGVLWLTMAMPICLVLSAQEPAQTAPTIIELADQNGAVVVSAPVQIRMLPDGVENNFATGADGRLSLDLAPGSYELMAKVRGFVPVSKRIHVQNGPQRPIVIVLNVSPPIIDIQFSKSDPLDPSSPPLGELASFTALIVAGEGTPKDLCNEGGVICVSPSIEHSLISNPFALEVRVNSTDNIEVDWEIKETTGKVLESASTYDDINESGGEPPHRSDMHLRGFILQPSESESGILVLKPGRFSISTGKTNLPPLEIPVRLTTEKTTVTWLEAENPAALQGAVTEWIDGGGRAEFKPKLKLVPRYATIMRVEPDTIIGATAEAVLHFNKGQGEWFVTAWRRDGDTAHVTIHGDGWAGVTYYLTGVSYLIQESALALPGIKTFVFDQAK